MNTLTKKSEKVLRRRVVRRIEVEYVPVELRARYQYTWSGVRNRGVKKLFKVWAIAPTHGLQFDPLGLLEDL